MNTLSDTDTMYLRRAIQLSRRARKRGNRPFGAVIVGTDDSILAEARNNALESGDCTGHAELRAVRLASVKHSADALAGATLYASAEPCVMCAGAIFWARIGRVVFGIDTQRLRAYRGEQGEAPLSCHAVFAASPHPIECIGPALADEAAQWHEGFWRA